MTVEVVVIAYAQVVRPDVAQAKWLAFPFAAMAWGMTERPGMRDAARQLWTITDTEPETIAIEDQLADFDAWRVAAA